MRGKKLTRIDVRTTNGLSACNLIIVASIIETLFYKVLVHASWYDVKAYSFGKLSIVGIAQSDLFSFLYKVQQFLNTYLLTSRS